jgi:hypothetical protein
MRSATDNTIATRNNQQSFGINQIINIQIQREQLISPTHYIHMKTIQKAKSPKELNEQTARRHRHPQEDTRYYTEVGPKLLEVLRESEEQIRNGETISFNTVEELIAHLDTL